MKNLKKILGVGIIVFIVGGCAYPLYPFGSNVGVPFSGYGLGVPYYNGFNFGPYRNAYWNWNPSYIRTPYMSPYRPTYRNPKYRPPYRTFRQPFYCR